MERRKNYCIIFFRQHKGDVFWYNIKIDIKKYTFCELPNSTCSEGAKLRTDEAI
jgi:hypothetical protein